MDKLVIQQSPPLSGEVIISGAKNAALPLLMASLLCDSPITFANVPLLRDINTSVKLLEGMGVKVDYIDPHRLQIDPTQLNSTVASYDLVRTMRASILVLGPLLARYGKGCVVTWWLRLELDLLISTLLVWNKWVPKLTLKMAMSKLTLMDVYKAKIYDTSVLAQRKAS